MKRLAMVFLLLSAWTLSAQNWRDAYDRGVAAVNASNYKVAADLLKKAISELPKEGLNVKSRQELLTYVPHFWLGIALFNLGDTDGALREWRICEEQGIVARTNYYPRMKDWIARAQLEKKREAQNAAAESRNAADSAISKAVNAQAEALGEGGDRTDPYANAVRKLEQANTLFQKAGTDIDGYRAAETAAQQAARLFSTAVEEGKRLKAARAAAALVKSPPKGNERPAVIEFPADDATDVPPKTSTTATVAPVVSEAEAANRLAEQAQRRQQIEKKPPVVITMTSPPVRPAPPAAAVPPPVAEPLPTVGGRGTTRADVVPAPPDLRPAYRAFAAGDLLTSERLLTGILRTQPAAEAYLLRGCARYTRAVLSRTPEPLLVAATDDFEAALARNASLRLDSRAFSPKLVEFFEQVRQRR